jgi:DAK2 domain fusion protein YloV
VAAGLAALEADRERIDNLNVYPVPDGDTGTNMVLTVRAAAEALDGIDAAAPEEVAGAITRACLMGARGNSGVILSQLVRGAAEALSAGGPVDPAALAKALRLAADAGYASVREPQEGTILTVARALAEQAEQIAARGIRPPLGEALVELRARGEEALARTPEQLPLLQEAGVVDAGGAGLLAILAGIAAHVRGEPLPEAPSQALPLPMEAVHRERSRYRYCTTFFVEGDDVEPERLQRELAELGDSLLVVGAPGALKVHVHTDDPGRALGLATAVGVVDEVEIANMHAQTAAREQRLRASAEAAVAGVVAVVAGAGNARLFRSMGATRLVAGGTSMNPSTAELVEAAQALAQDEVVLLPNNPNVRLTAERAAEEAQKRVVVVPTDSLQAGLSAMVAFDSARTAQENAVAMAEAAAAVRSGAVTRASRTTTVGGLAVEEGQFLGLVDGDAVAVGAVLEPVAREVLERLLAESSDVLTILVGEEDLDAAALRAEVEATYPDIEVEVHEGGQPHYPLLFAAE